jgi:hypothetical protein
VAGHRATELRCALDEGEKTPRNVAPRTVRGGMTHARERFDTLIEGAGAYLSGAECRAGPITATLGHRDGPTPDCSDQFSVVGFSLIGVSLRGSGQGAIHLSEWPM